MAAHLRILLLSLLLLPSMGSSMRAQSALGDAEIPQIASTTLLGKVDSHLERSLSLYNRGLFEGLLGNGYFSPSLVSPFPDLPENFLKSLAQVLPHLPIPELNRSELLIPVHLFGFLDEVQTAPAKRPNSFSPFITKLDFAPVLHDERAGENFMNTADALTDAISDSDNHQYLSTLSAQHSLKETAAGKASGSATNENESLNLHLLLWATAGLLCYVAYSAHKKYHSRKKTKSSRPRRWNRSGRHAALQPRDEVKAAAPSPPPTTGNGPGMPLTPTPAEAPQMPKTPAAPPPIQLPTPAPVRKTAQSVAAATPERSSARRKHHRHSSHQGSSGLPRIIKKILRLLGLRKKRSHRRRRRHHC